MWRPRGERNDRNESTLSVDDDMDEFGRPNVTRKSKKEKRQPKEKTWPPCFQDKSDVFVLDAGSGMFYHSESDFFYDPNSKLYYGNKKQAYFSYNRDTKRFVPIESSSETGSSEAPLAPPAGTNAAAQNIEQDQFLLVPDARSQSTAVEPPKTAIAIKLKTAIGDSKKKTKKSSEKKKNLSASASKMTPGSGADPVVTKLQKQHLTNIEVWSERGKEMQKERAAEMKLEQPPTTGKASSGSPSQTPAVAKTAKGKPICLLCKRKFPTIEKLRLHEEKSALHKENLEKQKKMQEDEEQKAKSVATSGPGYVDRAQQRRDMYGPEHVLPPPPVMPDTSGPISVTDETSEIAVPATNLMGDSSNIGHQMLQKLGWKSDKGLGRAAGASEGGGEGKGAIAGGNNREKLRQDQQKQQAALAQDWERIECLASKPQR